jgi:hypothetical protein
MYGGNVLEVDFLFRASRVIAAIPRARVKRAIFGFMPLAINAA